jgi:putative drug exporter of the RND superfamily
MTSLLRDRSANRLLPPDPAPGRGVFARLGRAVVAHPGKVFAIWMIVVAALIAISVALGQPTASRSETSQLPSTKESAQAQHALDAAFGAPSTDARATLVISRLDGRVLTGTDLAAANRAVAGLTAREQQRRASSHRSPKPAVVRVSTSVQPSPNRVVALVDVAFRGEPAAEQTGLAVDHVRKDISEALANTGLRARLTGEAAGARDNSLATSLATYGMIAAIFLLLLVLFRSPGLAVTIVLAITAVGYGVGGLLNIAAHVVGFHLESTVTGILPVVLYGVGTDYAVFLLYRYRERLRAGDDHRTAMANAIGRVGSAVVASALAVAVSFSAMLISGLRTFRILGPSLALAVLLMLLTSLTLLPAVLAFRAEKRARKPKWTRSHNTPVLAWFGKLVTTRPAAVAVFSVIVLAVLSFGALAYRASYDQQLYRSGSESALGYHDLQRGYPSGALYPTRVVVSADAGAPTSTDLYRFATRLGEVPGVGRVVPGRTTDDGRVTEIDLLLSTDPFSSATFHTVRSVETVAHDQAPPGTTTLVGGDSAAYEDVSTVMGHDMKLIFPLAGAAILLILILMLRALVAPLYLMASVVLGFAATLGATVAVFQGIAGHHGLNFQLPLIVYLFVASIGTDYNILMISRLREETRDGASPRRAANTAIRQAGPSVGAAGIVLAASFALLTISPTLAEIGFAVAAGVLISTFINAFLLIPALTGVLGRAAWWPARDRMPALVEPASTAWSPDAHGLQRP